MDAACFLTLPESCFHLLPLNWLPAWSVERNKNVCFDLNKRKWYFLCTGPFRFARGFHVSCCYVWELASFHRDFENIIIIQEELRWIVEITSTPRTFDSKTHSLVTDFIFLFSDWLNEGDYVSNWINCLTYKGSTYPPPKLQQDWTKAFIFQTIWLISL